jgi:CBS domain-containing protein
MTRTATPVTSNDKTRARQDAYSMRVEQILNRDVVAISAGETAHVALQTMMENRVAALPVLDRNDRCVGMISATDLISLVRELDERPTDVRLAEMSRQWLIEHMAEQDMDRRPVTELMSTQVEATSPTTPIVKAARRGCRVRNK